ncbi:MAG: hypothetical protein VKS61_17090 [Candidatus Sericytochromatia bacterium]|nr:hypothetical protein [Candidatus Sericytochromatia bacterium]
MAPPAAWNVPAPQAPPVPAVAPGQLAALQHLKAELARLQQQLDALIAVSQLPAPVVGLPVAWHLTASPAWQAPPSAPPVAAPPVPMPEAPPSQALPPAPPAPAPAGPRKARDGRRAPAGGDVFATARLDRRQPPTVSWYRPHRQHQTPELRLSGNVTADNFWREVALASMNVGMSPRRMARVLEEALPAALSQLGVRLDEAARAELAATIRRRTAGLPRANPIPPELHPDRTHKYLDDNPAAVGWRDRYGPMFDRMLSRGA